MGGISSAKIRDYEIDITLDDSGGIMVITPGPLRYNCRRGFAPVGREETRVFLLKHRKADIVDMVLGFVENAEEA